MSLDPQSPIDLAYQPPDEAAPRPWTRRLKPGGSDGWSWKVAGAQLCLAGLVLFGVGQLLPFGRNHTNPPVTGEPAWSSPRTRELAVRACYDCHSNETAWPWYTNVAPVSWWTTGHVTEGRSLLNFSEFTTNPGRKAGEAAEVVQDGAMPPSYFTLFGLHPTANLTDAEKAELVRRIKASGATSYLEVVSTSAADIVRSLEVANDHVDPRTERGELLGRRVAAVVKSASASELLE